MNTYEIEYMTRYERSNALTRSDIEIEAKSLEEALQEFQDSVTPDEAQNILEIKVYNRHGELINII